MFKYRIVTLMIQIQHSTSYMIIINCAISGSCPIHQAFTSLESIYGIVFSLVLQWLAASVSWSYMNAVLPVYWIMTITKVSIQYKCLSQLCYASMVNDGKTRGFYFMAIFVYATWAKQSAKDAQVMKSLQSWAGSELVT